MLSMYLQPDFITMEATVAEIVARDYRTAAVFTRHGIGYCCGGNKLLGVVCRTNGCDPGLLLRDLRAAVQEFRFPSRAEVSRWSIDFLIDYIINVHHYYLRYLLPPNKTEIEGFLAGHATKFPALLNLIPQLILLETGMAKSMREEEEVIFPYLRQLSHAHRYKDPYGALLVKTMRIPIDTMTGKEHLVITPFLQQIREITSNYFIPSNACSALRVALSQLKELDGELCQHLFLENSILYPKALAIEKELLSQPGK